MAKRMPKEARAAMNRIGMQDPKELERRKKRFRKAAAKYKAQDSRANIKRTAKDVGKELAMEAATFAVGGLAGKALAKGGKAAVKAYKVSKAGRAGRAGKAAKGAQKALKAGPKQKLLMAPRAQAAEKIKRSGTPVFKSRAVTAADKAQRARVMTTGKANRIIMNSKSSNSAEFKEAARFLRQQARRKKDAKKYKLNVSGKPPAPKPKAKRKKPAKRKAGAPAKETPSKPVKFNQKRKSYSETRSNRAVKNNPQRKLKGEKASLAVSKRIRRTAQKEMNEMQRKGTTEDMRRFPNLPKEFPDQYEPDKFIRRRRDTIKLMDEFTMPRERMRVNKAERRVKRNQIKPRRRK